MDETCKRLKHKVSCRLKRLYLLSVNLQIVFMNERLLKKEVSVLTFPTDQTDYHLLKFSNQDVALTVTCEEVNTSYPDILWSRDEKILKNLFSQSTDHHRSYVYCTQDKLQKMRVYISKYSTNPCAWTFINIQQLENSFLRSSCRERMSEEETAAESWMGWNQTSHM